MVNGQFVSEASYNRLDPYKIDDIIVPLNNSKGVRAGKVFLDQGNLINLSKVRRAADCDVAFYESANITFTCFIGFDNLQVNYTGNLMYENNVDKKFYPKVNIKNTNITVQVTSNREYDIPNLKLLFINNIGNITVTHNLSLEFIKLFTVIGPPIREALERKAIMTLHQAINGRFKDALAYSIYKTPLGLDN